MQKVLFLLLAGWEIEDIQDELGLDEEEIMDIIVKLQEDGYLSTHTVH